MHSHTPTYRGPAMDDYKEHRDRKPGTDQKMDRRMDHRMEHGMDRKMDHEIPHEHLVMVIHHCEATCEHMTSHIKRKFGVNNRTAQLLLLRDCADICGLTANYIARDSIFAKYTAELCAHICEVCGRECAKHPDPESQECARICLHCAKECRDYAMR